MRKPYVRNSSSDKGSTCGPKYTTQNTAYDDGLDIWCAIIIGFSFHAWDTLSFAHPQSYHDLRQSEHYAGDYVSWSPADLLCWASDSVHKTYDRTTDFAERRGNKRRHSETYSIETKPERRLNVGTF